MCLKFAGWVANSVDPDEMLHSAASHLGLHFLLRPVCPDTYGKYGTRKMFCGGMKNISTQGGSQVKVLAITSRHTQNYWKTVDSNINPCHGE